MAKKKVKKKAVTKPKKSISHLVKGVERKKTIKELIDSGNSAPQFWKARSKRGRPAIFATPADLWKEACEYFQWCDDHPEYKNELTKNQNGVPTIVQVPTKQVYSLAGLTLWLGVSIRYFDSFMNDSEGRPDRVEFVSVIEQIKQVIHSQQFSGATLGFFNANIISRTLGLVDKKEINADRPLNLVVNSYKSGPPLARSEDEVKD